MAYARIKTPLVSGGEVSKWMDEVYERPHTYTDVSNPDGSKTYTKSGGELIQRGTNQSATNFNQLEDGVQQANAMVDLIVQMVTMFVGHSKWTLDQVVGNSKWTLDQAIDGSETTLGELDERFEGGLAKILRDAQDSIHQAEIRALEERIRTLEAQVAALGS